MNKKVMIIDDDQELLEELKDALEPNGYDVVVLADAGAALDVAGSLKPDCILLDLKMPKKSGFRVADELKHFQELSHIPIIVITGVLKEDYLPLMNLCGIQKCIKKPFTPMDIISNIEQVLAEEK
ncbi:MAG: hypothetical protein A3K83_01280 [Omnitrophica WOR_2 bacterium RBG_13_44_8b]|nr:MAG: hypothetical protein A3K83_01280 [Omnitrophica WOR_2 bacterium RBG_13_44_8b]